MEGIRFSIITVTYNAANFLAATVNSVLNQNRKDYEYIFIDGASTDTTNQVIKKYVKKLNENGIPTKHVFEKDRGISDAFNKGIERARGEIIVILNAADELLPGALDRVNKEMNKGVDIVYGNCIWIDEVHGLKYVRKSKKDLSKLMYKMDIIHPATFVKRSLYKKNGCFDISFKYCMDEELLVRMQKKGAVFKYIDFEFVIMKAGGISDKNVWPVIQEGARIPQKYGESVIKIKISMVMKWLRHNLAHFYRYTTKFIKR